jgi:CelD/BcsL family acetyltransferase involved in cellulose biosynthesis
VPELETEIRALEEVAAEWDRLADRVGASPFVRPGWIAAWERAFDGPVEVECVREAGGLVAALAIRRGRLALAGPTNWHTPAFGGVAAHRGAVESLATALIGARPPRLALSFLDADDPLLAAVRAASRDGGLHTSEDVVGRPPFISLEPDWDTYEASRPAKRRADLRRRLRRLSEHGAVEFEVSDGGDSLSERLAEIYPIEASGWKGRRGTAMASRPETRLFYELVAAWAATRGWFRLWTLRLASRPIAFAYCLDDGDAHYVVKIGYDAKFSQFGPGNLLTREMLRAAFETGLRRYEFLGTDDPYKLEWTDTCHELVRIQVFGRALAGTVTRLAWERGRPLVRALRRSR